MYIYYVIIIKYLKLFRNNFVNIYYNWIKLINIKFWYEDNLLVKKICYISVY